MMSHVKPEDLLDAADYRRWQKIQRKLQGTEEEEEEEKLSNDGSSYNMEEAHFEACSTQAWTHILSQLVKVPRENL